MAASQVRCLRSSGPMGCGSCSSAYAMWRENSSGVLSRVVRYMKAVSGAHGEQAKRAAQTEAGTAQVAAKLSLASARQRQPAHLKMRQFLNCEKNWLDGWSAQMTHLPMASASAVVVATTSLVDGLMNT